MRCIFFFFFFFDILLLVRLTKDYESQNLLHCTKEYEGAKINVLPC